MSRHSLLAQGIEHTLSKLLECLRQTSSSNQRLFHLAQLERKFFPSDAHHTPTDIDRHLGLFVARHQLVKSVVCDDKPQESDVGLVPGVNERKGLCDDALDAGTSQGVDGNVTRRATPKAFAGNDDVLPRPYAGPKVWHEIFHAMRAETFVGAVAGEEGGRNDLEQGAIVLAEHVTEGMEKICGGGSYCIGVNEISQYQRLSLDDLGGGGGGDGDGRGLS